MQYTFHCFGHPAIRATHVKTLEFTKDAEITERADCIVGVRADFDLAALQKFSKKIKVTCCVFDPDSQQPLCSEFKCKVSPHFDSKQELVLRKSGFSSERTFGVGLNRGANWLDRRIVQLLQDPTTEMTVTISAGWQD